MKKRQTADCTACRPESIVLLARERYGDVILMTPLIKNLRMAYPEVSIYIVAFTRPVFEFFSADANITETFHAKRNLFRYASKLLPKKFDLLFNPKNHPSRSFYLQSRLIRAKYKIGHRNTNHDELYDCLIDCIPGTHETLRNLSLLDALGKSPAKDCRPYVPEMPLSGEAASFLDTMPSGYYTGINISAGSTGGFRTFEQWSELINNFPEEQFVIFSSGADIEQKRAIENAHANIERSPSTKNLYEVFRMFEKLKLLVTPDTSLVHVASCSDTPVLALYRHNPADSIEFSPLSTFQEVLVSPTAEVSDIGNSLVSSSLGSMLKKLNKN
jgi:heptosyltransferase III